MLKTVVPAVVGFYVIMSLTALLLYGADKKRAKQGRWRIKEATLLVLGFFGGAAGALIGMKVFRHKTKHWYFWLINFAGLAIQAGLLLFLALA